MSDVNELHFAAYERTLTAAGRSPKTLRSYLDTLALLADFTGADDVTAVDKASLEEFMADQLARFAASSAGLRFRNLRAFYSWAVREEIIDVSPMARMTEPKAIDEPPAVIPDDDLRALLRACDGKTYEDRRDSAVIRLWCEPGSPRLEEMSRITLEDLDMRRAMVRLLGKGNKVRVIPFGAKTGTALDRFLRMRAKHPRAELDGRLWLSSVQGRGNGHALTPSGLTQMLNRRVRTANIGHIHPHQFRHTAAHVWQDQGGSEGDAMALFGWSSAEMPRRYGRSAQVERAQRAARRMSAADRI